MPSVLFGIRILIPRPAIEDAPVEPAVHFLVTDADAWPVEDEERFVERRRIRAKSVVDMFLRRPIRPLPSTGRSRRRRTLGVPSSRRLLLDHFIEQSNSARMCKSPQVSVSGRIRIKAHLSECRDAIFRCQRCFPSRTANM